MRSFVRHRLPPDVREIEPELDELGALAAGPLWNFQCADRANEPRLTRFDAWGNRIDYIEPSPLWREAERLAKDAAKATRKASSASSPVAR